MLKENKIGKYLLYATGEIILVVIGIVIALQINNWNEANKLENLETDILIELEQSLNRDLNNIKACIKEHNQYLKSTQIISKWINNQEPYNDSLNRHFMRVLFNGNFISNHSDYVRLKNLEVTTNTNSKLLQQLSKLYDIDFQDLYDWQNEFNEQAIYFGREVYDSRFESIGIGEDRIWAGMKPIDPLGIKNDIVYRFHLKLTNDLHHNYINYTMTEVLHEIEKTIEALNDELEKRIKQRNANKI